MPAAGAHEGGGTACRTVSRICMEGQREYDIDDLLRKYEAFGRGNLKRVRSGRSGQKGVDAAGFHVWERQRKKLAVLRSLRRLRPEWMRCLTRYRKSAVPEQRICLPGIWQKNSTAPLERSSRRAEWENIGEQLLKCSSSTISAVPSTMTGVRNGTCPFSVSLDPEILARGG